MQVVIILSCLSLAVQGRHKYRGSRQVNGGGNYFPVSYGGDNGNIPPNYAMAQSAAAASASAILTASASASTSTSESFTVLRNRWTETHSYCNTVMGRVAKFIAKIEDMTLGLPLAVIKAALGIPSDVVKLSISLAKDLLPSLDKAKHLLEGFFQTMFDVPAKALYGSISIFADLINRILDWGQTCHGKEVCSNPFPNVGGYGPCGGQWPCTKATACQTNACISTARELQLQGAPQLGETK